MSRPIDEQVDALRTVFLDVRVDWELAARSWPAILVLLVVIWGWSLIKSPPEVMKRPHYPLIFVANLSVVVVVSMLIAFLVGMGAGMAQDHAVLWHARNWWTGLSLPGE